MFTRCTASTAAGVARIATRRLLRSFQSATAPPTHTNHTSSNSSRQSVMVKRTRGTMQADANEKRALTGAASSPVVHESRIASHSVVPRAQLPPAVLLRLETLLGAAVKEAQAAGDLPPHEWTPFTVSVMASVRPATHYTASVIKHVHAYNLARGHSTATMSGAKPKKKRKVQNDRGEWSVINPNDKAACDAFDAAQATAAAAAASAPNAADADTPMAGDSSSAAAPAPASSSSPSAPPANAYEWALAISRHLERLVASNAGDVLRSEVAIEVDVPKADASIRGGGFIDFTIKALQPTGSTATGDAAAASSAATSSAGSSSPVVDGVVAPPSLATATAFSFASIGTIDSVFKLKYGTPRQGTIAPSSRGSLTLHPSLPPSSLDGLDEYSHVWLVFIFHRNENKKWRPKIEPPRAGGRKMGVFATRTPHRVNPVGLSLVKLDRIEGRTLHLSSLDLIQGTPIIDIKPYHPADCMPNYTIPAWMTEQALEKPPFAVAFTEEAQTQLEAAVASGQMEFYHTVDEAREAIRESVSLDPRPIYVRNRASSSEVYGYRLDRLNVLYQVDDAARQVRVAKVELVDYERIMTDEKDEDEQQEGQQKATSSEAATRMDTSESSSSAPAAAAAAGRTSSAKSRKGGAKHQPTPARPAADEELITKKFLQQREKRNASSTSAAAATTATPGPNDATSSASEQ